MSIFNKFKKTKIQKNADSAQASASNFPHQSAQNARGSALLLVKQAWITEKAGDLAKLRKYIFIIDKKANKSEIKKNIELIYKVKVNDVNIINMKGKTKRLGKSVGKTSSYKKAIVTLKEGNKIDIMPT